MKIAVIDDDKIVLKMVESTLTDYGFEVHTYNSPVEGLKAIQESPPNALLLDRVMPEMDGNDVLMALQENPTTNKVPVIMLTANNDITDVTASLGLGARDYIVKPFDSDNLIIRLKNVMGLY